MDKLNIQYQTIVYKSPEESLDNLIVKYHNQDSSVETIEYGVRFIKETKDFRYLIEELRLPISINIKNGLNTIDFFLKKFNIISELKNLRKKLIIFKQINNNILFSLTSKKWNYLFKIYHIILVIQVFLLDLDQNDNTNELNLLKWCYYLNNLSLKKFKKYLLDNPDEDTTPLQWEDFEDQFQCLDNPTEPKNKLSYFKLLAEQEDFLINSNSNIGRAVYFKDSDDNQTKVGIIKSETPDTYNIFIPRDKIDISKKRDDVNLIKSLANQIYQLENTEEPRTFKANRITFLDNIDNIYETCIYNLIEYQKLMNYKIDYANIYQYLYKIIYMNIDSGYYLSKDPGLKITGTVKEGKPKDIVKGGILLLNKPFLIGVNLEETSDTSYKLCNQFEINIKYQGITYPSVEHAYVAHKFPLKYRRYFSIGGDFSKYENFSLFTKVQAKIDLFKKKQLIGSLASYIENKYKNKNITQIIPLPKPEKIDNNILLDLLKIKFRDGELKSILISTGKKELLYVQGSKESKVLKNQLICVYKNNRVYGGNLIGKFLMTIRQDFTHTNIETTEIDDTPDTSVNVFGNEFMPNHLLSKINITEIDILKRPYIIKYVVTKEQYKNKLLKNCQIKHINYKKVYTENIINDIVTLKQKKRLNRNILIEITNDRIIERLDKEPMFNEETRIVLGIDNKHLDRGVKDKDFYTDLKKYSYSSDKYPFRIYGFQVKNINQTLMILSYYQEMIDNKKSDIEIERLLLNDDITINKVNMIFNTNITDITDEILSNLSLIKLIKIDIINLKSQFGHLTLGNFMLKRLLYAQFTQHPVLLELLIDSNDTLLLGYDKNGYYHLNALMELRYLVKNNQDNSPFYFNLDIEINLETKINKSKEIFQYLSTPINNNFPSLNETIIHFDDEPSNQLIQNIFDSEELKLIRISNKKNIREIESEENKIIENTKILLNELIVSRKSESFVLNLLDKYLKSQNLVYYLIPKNGDSLFFTLCDLLNHHNFLPDDYDKVNSVVDGHYILRDCANGLRNEVSNKLSNNADKYYCKNIFEITEEDDNTPLSLEQLLKVITNSLGLDDIDYLNIIKNSCRDEKLTSDKQIEGIWGGVLEIKVISAIFNVNIHFPGIDLTKGNPNIIDNKYTRILASKSRELFPKGVTYNNDKDPININLIWINNENNLTYFYSTRNIDSLLRYYVKKDNTEVIRERFNSQDMILVGNNWNKEGKFETIEDSGKKNIVINKKNWKNVRYYKDKDSKVDYLGKIIGTFIESPEGILFD